MAMVFGLIIAVLFFFVLGIITISYIRDVKAGKESFVRRTGRWLRDLFDTLTGLG